MKQLKQILQKDTVLCAALLLATLSSFLQVPKIEYIDFDVLSILLSLMLVVAGLKHIHFLDWVAVQLINRCHDAKQLEVVLLGITYVSSMFVTNDVALLTFVPFALVIGKKLHLDVGRTIILQTLAANLGSMLTPLGNPQNLFLYAHYAYTPLPFFRALAIPGVLSLLFLVVLWHRSRNKPLNVQLDAVQPPSRAHLALYVGLLLLNIAAIFHVIDKLVVLLLTATILLFINRSLFRQVDYSLLITFAGFFIFIGNISHLDIVKLLQETLLGTATGTYLAGLALSQFISNVPAAMLLAGLSQQRDALLLGVNIGGLGTLIASMASVISYKLFVAEHPHLAHSYLRMFLFYNFAGLLLIGAAVYVLCVM